MKLLEAIPTVTMLTILAGRMLRVCRLTNKGHDRVNPEPAERLTPPGVTSNVFNGFVTSGNNINGLNISIHRDKHEGVSCEWQTRRDFEGYPQTLHGGISFAILDELLAYAIFDRFRTFAVTLNSQTQWLGRIKIGEEIRAHAVVKRRFWRFVSVTGVIVNGRGRVLVKMKSTFYMPTKSEFKRLIDLSIMPNEALPYCGVDKVHAY